MASSSMAHTKPPCTMPAGLANSGRGMNAISAQPSVDREVDQLEAQVARARRVSRGIAQQRPDLLVGELPSRGRTRRTRTDHEYPSGLPAGSSRNSAPGSTRPAVGSNAARQAHRRAAEQGRPALPAPRGEIVGELRPRPAHENLQRQAATRATARVARPFGIRRSICISTGSLRGRAAGRPWGEAKPRRRSNDAYRPRNRRECAPMPACLLPQAADILVSQYAPQCCRRAA